MLKTTPSPKGPNEQTEQDTNANTCSHLLTTFFLLKVRSAEAHQVFERLFLSAAAKSAPADPGFNLRRGRWVGGWVTDWKRAGQFNNASRTVHHKWSVQS